VKGCVVNIDTLMGFPGMLNIKTIAGTTPEESLEEAISAIGRTH
jgi:hypothetical protein